MLPKGPNALNIHAYMNGEEEQVQEQQITTPRNHVDPEVIQKQFDFFVKQMQKYDKILNQVARNIQDIQEEGQLITDFYPAYIWQTSYQDDVEKKVVVNTDPQLAKVLHSIERNNRLLKEDMRAWVVEFAKTTKYTQILIAQNKILRQSLVKKNKQIVKLIQSIGEAENEQTVQLSQQLQLLKQQNGVLKQHLIKLKEDIQDRKKEEKQIEQALLKVKQQTQMLQKGRMIAEDQEEHLTKRYQLNEQWKIDWQKKKKKLQKQKQYLLLQKKEFQFQKQKIDKQLQIREKYTYKYEDKIQIYRMDQNVHIQSNKHQNIN